MPNRQRVNETINLFGSMESDVLCTLKQSACPFTLLKERYLWFTGLAWSGDEKCVILTEGWHGRMGGEEGRWGWIRWPHAPHQGVKVQLLGCEQPSRAWHKETCRNDQLEPGGQVSWAGWRAYVTEEVHLGPPSPARVPFIHPVRYC